MLTRIIATKREAIAARDDAAHEVLCAELEVRAAARSPRGFAESLQLDGTRVIAEVKRQSPSAGVIAHESLDIVAQATAYRDGGAAAISVLTDTPFFGGTLEDLATIAAAVPGVPLLRKDFLLDEFDLLQSRAYGADAVLLIARILDDERLAALIAEAARLDLAALVEVHDEAEVARAVAAGATIIGVNNRDLDDFTIDLQRTARLAPLVPRGVVLVAESGIEHGAHVRELAEAGVTRMLVGSALMRAESPRALLGELMTAGASVSDEAATAAASPQTTPPLVKLCGMRTRDDVRAAAAAGATHVGVLLAEGFRRSVSVDTGASLAGLAASLGMMSVGVITSTNVEEINRLGDASGVDLVQLSAVAAYSIAIDQLTCPAIVVVHVGDDDTPELLTARVAQLAASDNVVALLFDTSDAAREGGTGRAFNHELISGITAPVPILIAGGVTPATARAVLRVSGADGVDVASGIETGGHPDPARMRALVQAVTRATDTHDWYADEHGRFSTGFGGSYIPETLVPAVENLTRAWEASKTDAAFQAQLRDLLTTYVGRPTPLTFAERLTAHAGGARIYLKREDLCHTGAHKINNAIGQTLLAKRMGLTRVIAETGAGQHGVATATACALLGLECIVYMGEEDIVRQQPNVFRMQLLGATVVPVTDGTRTLKDAVNAAIRDWVSNVHDTFYVIGSVVGMHPFPSMVRDFQRVIGDEVRVQLAEAEIDSIDAIVACVGGGSNAIGIFHPFLDDAGVRLIGAEAGGDGIATGRHAAPIAAGSPGVLHGMHTYLMQTDDGQIIGTHSISAGLDYPGVGPEHAHLAATGRAEYVAVNDDAALAAVEVLCRTEGIIPALESAHAIALGIEVAAKLPADRSIVINLSGRGDKDLATLIERLAPAGVKVPSSASEERS